MYVILNKLFLDKTENDIYNKNISLGKMHLGNIHLIIWLPKFFFLDKLMVLNSGEFTVKPFSPGYCNGCSQEGPIIICIILY